MLSDYLHYALLIALAIALVTAAITDLRSRRIANWLTGGGALGAPSRPPGRGRAQAGRARG